MTWDLEPGYRRGSDQEREADSGAAATTLEFRGRAGLVAPEGQPGLVPLAEPPTFSVVIPVYQAAHTVCHAVESVLAQTVPPHEVLVCDDGSTDDLAEALSPYSGRITLLRQPHKGVAAVRNLGLCRASGEFVVTCDADDVQLPRLIEAVGELAMTRPDLDILCRASFVERDGQVSGLSRTLADPLFPADDQRKGILRGNFIPSHSAFRRQRLVDIGGFDETLRSAEDYDIWIRLLFAGARAGLLLEPLGIYRVHAGSLSSNEVWTKQGEITALSKLVDGEDLSGTERLLAREHIASCRRELRRVEARVALLEARPDARRRSLGVMMGEGQRWRTRAKAGVAVVAPRWAGRRLRPEPSWRTTVRAGEGPLEKA